MADAEKALDKLRKLASNRQCADCRTESRFGFESVCVKYNVFVCSNCKSAHQSFSHRVKHHRMSTWTMAEVDVLRKRNGGGNDFQRAVWYANMTPTDADRLMPREGDRLDKYKELILQVYEQRRFYDEDGYARRVGTTKPQKQSTGSPSPREQPSSSRAAAQPAAQAQAAPEVDLLSFSDSAPAPPASTNGGGGGDLDLFSFMSNASSAPLSSGGGDGIMLGGPMNPPPQQQPMQHQQNGFGNVSMGMPHGGGGGGGHAMMNQPMPPMSQGGMGMGISGCDDDPFAALQAKPMGMSGGGRGAGICQGNRGGRVGAAQQQQQQQHQQQFINAMAQATGDPFAGLHAGAGGGRPNAPNAQQQQQQQRAHMMMMQQQQQRQQQQQPQQQMGFGGASMIPNGGGGLGGMGGGGGGGGSYDPFAGL